MIAGVILAGGKGGRIGGQKPLLPFGAGTLVDTVIATAEHIVPIGVIAPDHVMTPAPVVDYLIGNG